MMQSLFFVLAVYGSYFFAVRRGQFDFVSVAFFSQLIYFMPGFYGYVINPYYPSTIPSIPVFTETFTVWNIALAATILSGTLYRPEKGTTWPDIKTSNAFDFSLIFVIVFSFSIEMYLGGGAFLSANKFEALESATRFSLLFGSASQIGLFAFAIQGKFKKLIIPLAGVSLLLYAGFRNDFALATIAAATFVARRNGVWIFAKPRFFVPLIAFILFIFLYKGFLVSYRGDRWADFYASLDPDTFLQTSLLTSEPFLTQSILNDTLIRNLSLPPASIFYSLFAAIPLISPLVGTDLLPAQFDFQEQLFPNLHYGVASNIYAYFYATLGWIGIVLFILAHCLLLISVSRWLGSVKSATARLGLMSVGAYLAFFIHRNDLTNALLQMNRPLVTLAVIWVISRYLAWPLQRRSMVRDTGLR
jgi:hypothetical protein